MAVAEWVSMDDGRIAQVGAAASGAAMDRVVARKRWSRRLAVAGGTVVALAAVGLWWLYAPHGSNRQTVDAAAVSIATVARERFEDYVPLRAQVEPARTVFLDAVEGGRVERLWVEDGARVRRGQALVELSNAGLQLDAVSREAQVIEQLNGVRALELALERNRLERDTSRAEIEYRLSQQRRDLAQQEALARAGFISAAALARLREDMDYQVVRHRLALENDAVTGRMQA
jgi:HlyD family secretion protein